MATGNFGLDKGYDAAAAITKFRAVKLSAAETVTPVTAVADVVHGWSQFTVTADEITRGKGASVRIDGITEAEAGGAIAVGAICTVDNVGRAVAAVSGSRVVGRCVGHPSANAGDRISLMIEENGVLAP